MVRKRAAIAGLNGRVPMTTANRGPSAACPIDSVISDPASAGDTPRAAADARARVESPSPVALAPATRWTSAPGGWT
jgi:hypothetical protein